MENEKFNMLNEDQKFVNEVLDKSSFTIKWLAEKIHMDYDLLKYQLRTATNYRQDVHAKIVQVFKKEGLVTNNKELCDKLKDELIDFSAVLSGSISITTRSVRDKIKDLQLTDSEKSELKKELKNQLNRVTDAINDLLITVDLK